MYSDERLDGAKVPEIGAIIRKARKDRGWTQGKLATLSGVALYHISPIEAHGAIQHFGLVARLCLALEINDWPLMVLASRYGLLRNWTGGHNRAHYIARIQALEEIAQELKRDARLGKAVRAMPERSYLAHEAGCWCYATDHDGSDEPMCRMRGDTPEEAMRLDQEPNAGCVSCQDAYANRADCAGCPYNPEDAANATL